MQCKRTEAEVVVHELTALSGELNMRRLDRWFAVTDRLRTEATDHLVEAARSVGVRRFVARSDAAWPFARTGTAVKTETDPLDPDAPAALRGALETILPTALHAPPPRRVPAWLGRLAAREAATLWITDIRGASNAKAGRKLGRAPDHRSWRTGFAEAVGA